MSNEPMDGGGAARLTSLLVEDIGVTRGLAVDGSAIYAVDDASFALAPGEALGIAGESGSGKTTLVHALLGHVRRGMSATNGIVTLGASDCSGCPPEELSGGERQGVPTARAVIGSLRAPLSDEILSSLAVLAQPRIIGLLRVLQRAPRLSLIFISHDMSVLGVIAHRIAVSQSGRLCERNDAGAIMQSSTHSHTRRRIEAADLASTKGMKIREMET